LIGLIARSVCVYLKNIQYFVLDDFNYWFDNKDNESIESEDDEENQKKTKKAEKLKEINREFEDDDDDDLVSGDGDDDDDEEEPDSEGDDGDDLVSDNGMDFDEDSEIAEPQDVKIKPKEKSPKKPKVQQARKVKFQDANVEEEEELKEDIYGRLVDSKGNIVKQTINTTIEDVMDDQNDESTIKLSKQLKGLFNRLTTANMHTIMNECTRVYYSNQYTRNQFINTIFNLFNKSLMSKVSLTPERISCEHAAFLCVLSTQIGNDFNIKLLEKFLNSFISEFSAENFQIDVKILDNLLIFLCFLYNFKLFSSKLIFSIINEKLLVELVNENNFVFIEKFIELITHMLSKIGFQLRKDSPAELKDLIDAVKAHVNKLNDRLADNADVNMRLKFMLESLNAIKNNNIRKLNGYSPELCETTYKQIKTLFNANTNVTQLNITLSDFLMANKNGKWWIVGSAWMNTDQKSQDESQILPVSKDDFNEKLLALAKKQHMNTDIRRNIFCIIMSAEVNPI
jgi:nucleolar MIF4G domain-containing protein 1